jgi:hypothetical protein
MKLFKIFILMLGFTGFAQQFTVSSKVSQIKSSGLHSIALSPEFRCNADLNIGGIRINDSKGKEVPYIMMTAEKSRIESGFENYPMLLKRVAADSVTQVLVQNLSGNKWNEITLAIANTDAVKTYSISGSYDNTEWFGLVNKQTLNGLSSHTDTFVYKTLSMPVNAYKYFKIEFDDKKSLPVNITAAGKITGKHITTPLQEIPNAHVKITELHLEKKTRITVTFNELVIINQVSFGINAPNLYNRSATLAISRIQKVKKNTVTRLETVESFELNSSSNNTVTGLDLIENKIVIEIDNKDNEPLDIAWVKLYQMPVTLVADLKAGEQYTVLGGDAHLAPPDYDLNDFKNKIPKNLPQATLAKPEIINGKPKGINADKSPWIMWACITVGALILAYFCYNLVRDMNRNENKGL